MKKIIVIMIIISLSIFVASCNKDKIIYNDTETITIENPNLPINKALGEE